MSGSEHPSNDDGPCSPWGWADPEGFIWLYITRHLVMVQGFPQGFHTLASMRLVSRAWRRGVSQAVEVLAPRPFAFTSDLLQLPSSFPGVKALRLRSPTQDGPSLDNLLLVLGQGCSGLRALAAYDFAALTPRGAEALGMLSCLNRLELEAPGEACQAALTVVTAAHGPLHHLRLLPLAGNFQGSAAVALITQQLTALRSLSLHVRDATAPELEALSHLTSLSALSLHELPPAAASAVARFAEACPALRSLHFDFQTGLTAGQLGSGAAQHAQQAQQASLSSLLPLASLAGLTHLSAPWELFWVQAQGVSQLNNLHGLEVDFHVAHGTALPDEEEPECSVICAALLRRLPPLRRLRLAGGGSELSSASLVEMTHLGPSLTALDLDCCFAVDNQVMEAVGKLSALRSLRLAFTCFDGAGALELGCLSDLTNLMLSNSAGVMETRQLVEAVAQVKSLRRLYLRGHPYLNGAALGSLLSALPRLELLQTTWKPEVNRAEDAALCSRWGRTLQHSMDIVREESSPEFGGAGARGWPENDGERALQWAGLL